ncbi:2-C-methyl-D-erythritol 4-phosphate cytidylyltransferase [Desulfurispira natronophila]|uniref:2-C-methyl-D-erythritol 4-phosphate cytidylyltransferase n=1 Tax=Desulfurispira natronophila TaxID=682562 RepID=A0A7W8DHF5_9BACT|nr:2-C-methyl-D-erythritol 4-phosphate cytidylyltransferase [Desulfurispira natronophila]MBB5022379.1 2-C-methyl-D-erythritol 4-phosphate cytidylyltransferase [Desulfurispira natronophila]
MERVALILAGGTGQRMGSAVPKQYLELSGRPVLQHTLQRFVDFCFFQRFVLVHRCEDQAWIEGILRQVETKYPVHLALAGSHRAESVLNGLEAVPSSVSGQVYIHDGVRPFVQRFHLEALSECLQQYAGAILACPAHDTVKEVARFPSIARTLDRRSLYLAQTPQAFELETIRHALRRGTEGLTDDASALERDGVDVAVVEGSRSNIKITTPEDMLLAEAILGQQEKNKRSL